MSHFIVTVVIALLSSGASWSWLQFVITRRQRVADHRVRVAERRYHEVKKDLDFERERLVATEEELAQTRRVQEWLETRCLATYDTPTHVSRCIEQIGHYGVHTDGELCWYGSVVFPSQDLLGVA